MRRSKSAGVIRSHPDPVAAARHPTQDSAPSDVERQYDAARLRGDWEAARQCLEGGAAAGDAFACGQLGLWHLLGHIVERDDAAGFRLVRAAARAGRSEARRLLATLYPRGRGVEENWAKAVDWLVRGAQLGDPDTTRQLAYLLPRSLAA